MGLAAVLGETLAVVAGCLGGTLEVLEVLAGQLLSKVSGFCWYLGSKGW